MIGQVSKKGKTLRGTIALTASKSESNRALIIRALCSQSFEIHNLATAEDTCVLDNILTSSLVPRPSYMFDVGAAGTTMRFLTAYLATRQGEYRLTGSARMKERPIRILVDALCQLGARIEYTGKDGYPPLTISGGKLKGGELDIDGSVSSQYLSALLLIAPVLEGGLTLTFRIPLTSRPYLVMTIKMMEHFGVKVSWQGNSVTVAQQPYQARPEGYVVEADWSSASYWYAMAALSSDCDLVLTGLKEQSLQGDAIVRDLFAFFGVHTEFTGGGIRLTKKGGLPEHFAFDFSDCPDLAQTMAVVVSALGVPSLFNGLHTLKIKETDRVEALKNELKKFGTEVRSAGEGSVMIVPGTFKVPDDPVRTYEDHRMAMAFAPLGTIAPVKIEEPEVVAKSYPAFWDDLKSVGYTFLLT